MVSGVWEKWKFGGSDNRVMHNFDKHFPLDTCR
jgi:hypothetical protein